MGPSTLSLIQSNLGQSGDRSNAITLFPGDFADEEDEVADKWASQKDPNDFFGDDNAEEDAELEKLQAELRREEEEEAAKRQRWIENARPPVRVPQIDERGRAYGRGGRKTAAARVWIQPTFPGGGVVVVNRRPLEEYFPRLSDRDLVVQPLVATETCGAFDVQCMVEGGGLTGQAGAIRHGLANALNHYNPDLYRPPLKTLGFLTRDARKVERKKVGFKKARKRPQWVRR
jgi:small subunit ribosomal protein S9